MINKFRDFLVNEFNTISPTKDTIEYREQLLTVLLECEQDCKVKGMTDENAIYQRCIDSLGDMKINLNGFLTKVNIIEKTVPRSSVIALTIVAITIFFIVGYLNIAVGTLFAA